MRLRKKLTGVTVNVPDEDGVELLEKGNYLTPDDYDAYQREVAAGERDALARKAGYDPDAGEDDNDEKPAKETAAQKRKREKAEADAAAAEAEAEAARLKAEEDAAAAAAAGAGS